MPEVFPYRPASHGPLQAAVVSPAALPYRPALQLVHSPAPAREYWPAGHSNVVGDVDPAGHAYPAAHGPSHVDTFHPDELPYRPASHGPVHVEVFVAFVAPYRPALQLVQAAAPESEYWPAGHKFTWVMITLAVPPGQ